MTIKSDSWIRQRAVNNDLIQPFFADSIAALECGKKVTSFGLSSYGYDVRLGRSFKFFGATMNEGVGPSLPRETQPWISSRKLDVKNVYEKASIEAGNHVLTNRHSIPHFPSDRVIDPCNFDDTLVTMIPEADELIMPPHSFCLGVTMERVKVPRNVSVTCMGKSTVARAGIIVVVTPLEAGWEGYVTLEITNVTDMPVRLTAGMGITQLQFWESDEHCMVSYADRKGKYQDQPAIPVTPRPL